MPKKRSFNQSNILALLGRPVFTALTLIFELLISIFRFFANLYLPRFPKLSFSRFSINLHFHHLPSPRRVIFFGALIYLTCFVYYSIFYNLPDPHTLNQYPSKITTQILDRNGKLLYKVYKDENRTPISLNSLPSHVKNAFLAAEDHDFYNHRGYSVSGLFRAIYKNIFDEKMEGGSTITQQLVKNTLLTNEKTIIRKIKELILSVETEYIFTKDKIFEMYLNQVGFGGPAYGIQEASRQYFDVDAKDLSISQASFLAGITRAPSKYSPFGDNPELSLTRQRIVLQQMRLQNYITETDYQLALNALLNFRSAKIEIKAPHFVMFVKNLLVKQLGENIVNQGRLKVYTTLDLDLQEKAQAIVSDEINKLKSYQVGNGAALITNPKTGEILVMVGSTDYFDLPKNGQVNLTTALRQPGSAIKPLNYALSFENGKGPGSIIEDKPIVFNLSGQEPWIPKNYDNRFHGIITLRQALASSYNIPSILLLSENGPVNFAKFAKKLGISTWTDQGRFGLAMALGSLEVRMTDMVTAYSAFANNGVTTPLKAILKLEKSNASPLNISSCPGSFPEPNQSAIVSAEEDLCVSRKTISPTTAYLISDILSDNSARTPAFGANSILNIKNAKVSVKTGTSNDMKDNWTIGYNQDYLVATWVGNNDSTPMSRIASGITGASLIWAKIFTEILKDNSSSTSSAIPDNLIRVPICILTGTLTCNGCPTRYDYFVKGTEPQKACDPIDIQKRLNPTVSPSPTQQIL